MEEGLLQRILLCYICRCGFIIFRFGSSEREIAFIFLTDESFFYMSLTQKWCEAIWSGVMGKFKICSGGMK